MPEGALPRAAARGLRRCFGKHTKGLWICTVDRGLCAVDAEEAMISVAEHVRASGLNYATEGLVTDRSDAGWLVYASTRGGGRALDNGEDSLGQRADSW